MPSPICIIFFRAGGSKSTARCLPFGDVDDRVARLIGNGKTNHDKASEIQNGSWFEPEVSKGNVARAIFYIRTIYSGQEKNKENVEFFDNRKGSEKVALG